MQKVARQLGRYHVLDRIAYGGMAEIFRAITFAEAGSGLLVAIKQVLPHYAEDREFIDMLVDEAKLVSMLHHPNIVEIYEVGNVDEFYFLAMEFVWGKDLRSVLEKCRSHGTRIPFEVSAYLMSEALSGLDTAHRLLDPTGRPASLVHRDFSPSNILISYTGDVKICDFGIAKANFSRMETKTGVIKGKVKYMSPEQAYGRKLDHRSDLFSAGSCFYEMLTSQPPFMAGNEIDLIFMVRDAQLHPVTQFTPNVPTDLEKVVYRSMARARSQRYQSAAEFRVNLVRYLRNRGAGDWKSELGRFMKALYPEELTKERRSLNEYVLGYEQESVANLGRNLIADALGVDAAYTKFNPFPTKATSSPVDEEVHDASTRIIHPAEIEDLETVIRKSPLEQPAVSEQSTRILEMPEAEDETETEARTGFWSGPNSPHREETAPKVLPEANPAVQQHRSPAPHQPSMADPRERPTVAPMAAQPPAAAAPQGNQLASLVGPPPGQHNAPGAPPRPPVASAPPTAPPPNRSPAPQVPNAHRPTVNGQPPPSLGAAVQRARSNGPAQAQNASPRGPRPIHSTLKGGPPVAAPPAPRPPAATAPAPRGAGAAPMQPVVAPPPAGNPRRPTVAGFPNARPNPPLGGPPPTAPPPRNHQSQAGPPRSSNSAGYQPPQPGNFAGGLNDDDLGTMDYEDDPREEPTRIAAEGRASQKLIEADTQEDPDKDEETLMASSSRAAPHPPRAQFRFDDELDEMQTRVADSVADDGTEDETFALSGDRRPLPPGKPTPGGRRE